MQSKNYTNQPAEVSAYLESEAAEERSGRLRHRMRLIILVGVIALAVTYMVYAAFPGNTQYFVSVSEFLGDPKLHDGQTLRVAGALDTDSFRREDGSAMSRFSLGDKAPDVLGLIPGSPQLEASYVGVLPDLFFNPHSEIILEGSYDAENGIFATDHILVKCPSKYQSLQAENPEVVPGAAGATQGGY
jgi:cytochrome c-type biogenesis protein CcmE